MPIVEAAAALAVDEVLRPVIETALTHLKGGVSETAKWTPPATTLTGAAKDRFEKGAEIYRREGHCITCHQENGQGLPAAQFPPLEGSDWVTGDTDRLIKLTLHGLLGPIDVKGKHYLGLVPMTPFKGLSDEEIASVLTFEGCHRNQTQIMFSLHINGPQQSV